MCELTEYDDYIKNALDEADDSTDRMSHEEVFSGLRMEVKIIGDC